MIPFATKVGPLNVQDRQIAQGRGPDIVYQDAKFQTVGLRSAYEVTKLGVYARDTFVYPK